MLQQSLAEEWASLHLEGRLTRSARAALMDVSVGTADRIFRRKGNDRAVLQHVFNRVGLPWEESYCERVEPQDASPSENDEVQPRPRTALLASLRSKVFAALMATALCATAISLIAAKNPADREQAELVARVGQAQASLNLAWQAYHDGTYDKADVLIRKTKNLASRAGSAQVMAEALRLEGEVLAARGNIEDALSCYERALEYRKDFRYGQATASLLEVMGNAEAKMGKYELAETYLTESYRVLKECGDSRGTAGSARSLGNLAAMIGKPDRARSWFQTALAEMKGNPDPQLQTDIKAQEAMLLCDEGRSAEAVDRLEECLAWWSARGHQRWVATTLFQIARAKLAMGSIQEAVEAARGAKQRYEQVGDRLGSSECAIWLDEHASERTSIAASR